MKHGEKGEEKEVGRVGERIIGKVVKKEGKDKGGKEGNERMLSYCNVHIFVELFPGLHCCWFRLNVPRFSNTFCTTP